VVLPVETKVYVPPSVIKTPARPQRYAGLQGDSPEAAVRSFVDTLPKDVRERIGQARRDPEKGGTFDRGGRSDKDGSLSKIQDKPRSNTFSPELIGARAYSSPSLNPGAVLLQVQLSSESFERTGPTKISELALENRNKAYISAGGQKGGEAAAFAASVARDELSKRVQIVAPILTSVNLIT